MSSLLDNPVVLNLLFYPRAARATQDGDGIFDGTIPVDDDIVLGYRLYVHQPGEPVILYFHGNGEIASDYDGFAPLYHAAGASLLVVDYRGYGWSTGRPLVSALLADALVAAEAVPGILRRADLPIDSPLVAMGRSLGSAPAIHLAHEHPGCCRGLIIESGFAHALPLLARLGIPTDMLGAIPDPIGNVRKISEVDLPLLVIHGERDTLIPVANGQALYDASAAADRRLVRIPGAGHNDLMFTGQEVYFSAVSDFLIRVSQAGS